MNFMNLNRKMNRVEKTDKKMKWNGNNWQMAGDEELTGNSKPQPSHNWM